MNQRGLSPWSRKRLGGPEDGGDGGVGSIPGRNSRTERIRHEAGEQALSERGVRMVSEDGPPRLGVRVCGQGRVWLCGAHTAMQESVGSWVGVAGFRSLGQGWGRGKDEELRQDRVLPVWAQEPLGNTMSATREHFS